jgi:glycerol-3-phosphate dehydrogenase (NAD(P)+)
MMLGILGAGSWGTGLALQASRNGQAVYLWEHNPEIANQLNEARANQRYLPDIPFPDNLHVTSDLADCVGQSSEILVVVPSIAFRSVVEQLKPLISEKQGLAWATKGLDPQNGELLYQVAEQILGKQNRPTAISLASNSEELAERIVGVLHGDTFRIYTSDDIAGVCLGGAYKNVLAIAAGIADGLMLGHNARAALITRGLAEMQRLGCTLGGQAETFTGLAGLGDLVLTCTGDLSRNRRLGMALAKGESLADIQANIGQVTEGVETARVIHKLASAYHTDLPIAEKVYQVLFENHSPIDAVTELLSREPRKEF